MLLLTLQKRYLDYELPNDQISVPKPNKDCMQKLRIKVKPNSKQQEIKTAEDGSLVIRLKSPPVDGKANAELIQLLSDRFNVPKSSIHIKSGTSAKLKLIEIDH